MSSLEDIGEKSFLRSILPGLARNGIFVNGFGHDASLLDLGLERHIAFKIDRAPSPIAISRGWSDFKVWGRLAVVANVSDLLATAALPQAMMLSVVLPRDLDAQKAADIITGCEESCAQHGVAFVGGDTKEGAAVQVVGAALGTAAKAYWLGRNKAVPGDHLIIAGMIGGFSGALSLLDAGEVCDVERQSLLSVLTEPVARIREGAYIRESKILHSCMDLSDGLAEAISNFSSDNVGITINEDALPLHRYAIDAAHILSVNPSKFAFSVGDWAIAGLVSEGNLGRFLDNAPTDLELCDLGVFDSSGKCLLKAPDGSVRPIPKVLNEQFRTRLEDDGDYFRSVLDA
ncbi:thiamine-phosphate kinase [Burkholderia ambifaria]|uniref:thiamine-phosphate kinase n=1 Tax=Burkholderia ambifaria TaxID=152480 RepID=UPI001588369D|nr:AIR synthase related protein [Burkholderia ambifaria]